MKKALAVLLFVVALLTVFLTACREVRDPIVLRTWEVGRIQLNSGAKIFASSGVEFTDENGNVIDPTNMAQGVFYNFKKVSPDAQIWIETVKSMPSTHVVLAKATNQVKLCPNWARDYFGDHCESTSFSISR